MPSETIVNLLVTGIIALVPSAQDPDVIRLVAPNHHTKIEHAQHQALDASAVATLKKVNLTECRRYLMNRSATLPEHFAFIDIPQKHVAAGGNRVPDFRYQVPGPAEDREHFVYILRSENIEFATANTDVNLVRTGPVPMDLLRPTDEERRSTSYILKMGRLCQKCTRIDNRYFDILAHPDKSSMRMDIRGGTLSAAPVSDTVVWQFEGTETKQPLAEKVVFALKMPGTQQQLQLTSKAPDAPASETETINLQPVAGKIDIKLGNAPLVNIIPSLFDDFPDHADHFELFYDLFVPEPSSRPSLTLIDDGGVSGIRTPCLTPELNPQDPSQ